MRINILASVDRRPSGVNRTLVEFANHLTDAGHAVTVIKAINRGPAPAFARNLQLRIRELGYLASGPRVRTVRTLPWIKVRCRLITVPALTERYLPEADVTLFSFEYHLPAVERLGERFGRKVMRVCNILFAERAERLPADVALIANSSLVQRVLRERLNRETFLLVNGVNLAVFNNPDKPAAGRPRSVGMFFYNRQPAHKGMEDGFWVLEQLHRHYPGLQFQVAGEWRERTIPRFVRFYDGRRLDRLVDFYRTTDVFLYPGKADACPNPPMEALACRCALVSTLVGGIEDYTVPDRSALVAPPGDRDGLLRNAQRLIEDETLYQRIAAAGHEKVREFSTERQAQRLEEILRTVLERPDHGQTGGSRR